MSLPRALATGWQRWRRGANPETTRWVVLDTETSGLDPNRDALLAIGGVAMDARGIHPADSFEVVVHNEGSGRRDNVVVHRIGYDQQRAGTPADESLRALVAWVAESPCVGFHCSFDSAVLATAARRTGIVLPRWRWLDVAMLAAALEPQRYQEGCRDLDGWLAATGITTSARHNAAADALATAELLLQLRARAGAAAAMDYAALSRIARQQRWLARGA